MTEFVKCPRCAPWGASYGTCQLCHNLRSISPELAAAYRLLVDTRNDGLPLPTLEVADLRERFR